MQTSANRGNSELTERTNQIGIDFLFTDLDMGHTFLQLAHTAAAQPARERCLSKAHEAYRTVVRLMPRVVLAPDEQLEIQSRLEDLRRSLVEAGYTGEI